jgi:hypothetical protein
LPTGSSMIFAVLTQDLLLKAGKSGFVPAGCPVMEEIMDNQLFRKKSIDRISSPEKLEDYMRVTSPRLWMLLSAIVILLVGFLVMVILRFPIAYAVAISSIFCLHYQGLPLTTVCMQMVKGISSFSLMAVPFFITMGVLMGSGGISEKLLDLADTCVCRSTVNIDRDSTSFSVFFSCFFAEIKDQIPFSVLYDLKNRVSASAFSFSSLNKSSVRQLLVIIIAETVESLCAELRLGSVYIIADISSSLADPLLRCLYRVSELGHQI